MRAWLEERVLWLQEHFIAVELVTCAIAIVAIIFSGLQYYTISQEYALAKQQLASSSASYKKVTENWREKFAAVTGRNQSLSDSLTAEQQKNIEFETQIKGVQNQLAILKKLSETDKELLQKYSKVYFLSENYEPASTTLIAAGYLSDAKSEQRFQTLALPFLMRMIDDAASADVSLRIVSGYRSFGYQSSLKSDYKVSYGTGANSFSADQGYSEHQLGTAVDLSTAKMAGTLSGFADTDGFKWLQENAYRYGFVLSYPKGNAYYIYEPWHWRFVGVALAARLHSENKNFYDLDQREIDGYLALLFN